MRLLVLCRKFWLDAITARKEAIDEFVLQGFDLFVDLTQGEEIVREHESIPLEELWTIFQVHLISSKKFERAAHETDQGQKDQICSSLEQFSYLLSSGFGSSGLNLLSRWERRGHYSSGGLHSCYLRIRLRRFCVPHRYLDH